MLTGERPAHGGEDEDNSEERSGAQVGFVLAGKRNEVQQEEGKYLV